MKRLWEGDREEGRRKRGKKMILEKDILRSKGEERSRRRKRRRNGPKK